MDGPMTSAVSDVIHHLEPPIVLVYTLETNSNIRKLQFQALPETDPPDDIAFFDARNYQKHPR